MGVGREDGGFIETVLTALEYRCAVERAPILANVIVPRCGGFMDYAHGGCWATRPTALHYCGCTGVQSF